MTMERYAEIWGRLALATSRLHQDAAAQDPFKQVDLNEGEQQLLICLHQTLWKVIVELGMETRRLY